MNDYNIVIILISTVILPIILMIDIVVTIIKIRQQSKLWDMIKDGEISYIRAVRGYGDIHGYTSDDDEDGKDLPSE